MQQNPYSEANSFRATQILSILWNPKVPYRVYKSPPLVRNLSQFNPGQPQNCFLKINIILSTPESSNLTPSVRFPHKNPVYTSPRPHGCYTSHPSCYSWFIHLNIWCWVQIMKLLIMECSRVPLGPNIFLSTLFSNTVNLCSSLHFCQRRGTACRLDFSARPCISATWNEILALFVRNVCVAGD